MTDPDVIVREVGPRDGLQSIETFFPTPLKKEWIRREYEAGVRHAQVTSFVPPKVIPQLADSAEIAEYSLTLDGLIVSAFIPNLKGAQRGLESGIHTLGYVVSASEAHNQSNVRRSIRDSMEDFRRVVELRDSEPQWKKTSISGGIATAFGCTLQGEVDAKAVLDLAEELLELGAEELLIADTVGYGNPRQVKAMFEEVLAIAGDVPVSAHFHDTRGLGLANVGAALEAGIRIFDSSLGGLGGCPFAPGATGNIVTEDLVFMLEAMGLHTGIDIDRLMEVRAVLAEGLPDEHLYSAIAKAGLPKGFEQETASAHTEN